MRQETRTKNAAGRITPAMLLFAGIVTFMPLAFVMRLASAEGPAWWSQRQVLDPASATNDYAPVNLGQLKWIATNAAAELDERLPGGSGTNIQAILTNWLPDNVNYGVANVGQLKNLADAFYARLIQEYYTNNYPWMRPDNGDYSVALIGQVKALFGFDLVPFRLAAVSGTIQYPGWSTGNIYVLAATNALDWTLTQPHTFILSPSFYTITNATRFATNWFRAWCDSNGNGVRDFAEASGEWSMTPCYLSGNMSGVNITLGEPDFDGDGFLDCDELAATPPSDPADSNSVPVTVQFTPETVVILTNRLYSSGFSAQLQPRPGCTSAIPSAIVQRMATTSTCDTVAEVTSRFLIGNSITYNIQSGTNGTAWVQAMLGTVSYASQTVYSASATWNETTIHLGVAPTSDWTDVPPVYVGTPDKHEVGLNVRPTNAIPWFCASNSNPTACLVEPQMVSGVMTGVLVTALTNSFWSWPMTSHGANVAAVLDGLSSGTFSCEVVQVYFPASCTNLLTNDTRVLDLSVTPAARSVDVWTINHNPTIVTVTRTVTSGIASWTIHGLAQGTAYVDARYGTSVLDRIRIDVMNVAIPDCTNLVMALDSVELTNTYDWCKVCVGDGTTVYDWSWYNTLEIVTEPAGVVNAVLLTNQLGVTPPYFPLYCTPAADAGGSAIVKLRLRPTPVNGNATNEYARLVANVVKARPFTTALYVAKDCTGTRTIEGFVPLGGWGEYLGYGWPHEYGPLQYGPILTVYPWDGNGRAETFEYRWVIDKQYALGRYNEQTVDVNERYNPTCMVYFCDFAFTNVPYMGVVSYIPFTPVTYLPTNAPANFTDSRCTLRQVGGTGAISIDFSGFPYGFGGSFGASNSMDMTSRLVQTIDPNYPPSQPPLGAKVWTLPGQVVGVDPGQVDLEYLITNQYGVIASNIISLYVVHVNVQVDSNNDGGITSGDDPDEMTPPGSMIFLNRDDDNCNGTKDMDEINNVVSNENDLAEVRLEVAPAIPNTKVRLTVTPPTCFRLWTTSEKEQLITTREWDVTNMPSVVYLEGKDVCGPFSSYVLLWYLMPGSSQWFANTALVSVVDSTFSKSTNTAYGYDDGKVNDEPIPNARDFNETNNPGGQGGQLYDWVDVAAQTPTSPPINETHVTLTIQPAACAQYVHIKSEDNTVATCDPMQATNAVQEVKIVGGTLSGIEMKMFTQVTTSLGSTSGAKADKINVAVYKPFDAAMRWVTVRSNMFDSISVDPVPIRTGANQLINQLVVVSSDSGSASTNTADYDLNGNGFLDIVDAGMSSPTNEVPYLGISSNDLKRSIIYVNKIRHHTASGYNDVPGCKTEYYPDCTIYLAASASLPVITLAHEIAHTVMLYHIGPVGKNERNIMKPGMTTNLMMFGYFRVEESPCIGSSAYQEQWNEVSR